MFIFGDIARTTKLFHSSNIDELMAEPPVVRDARKPHAETAAVSRLSPRVETATVGQATDVQDPASSGQQIPAPRRMRAAA